MGTTPTSSNGAQSSLHSFFQPKPASSAGRTASDAVDLTGSPPPKRAKVAPTPAQEARMKAIQSSYFTPKALSSAPRPKPAPSASREPNAALETFRLPRGAAAAGAAPAGAAFGSYAVSGSAVPRSSQTVEQERRSEAWRALPDAGAVLPRRRSLALDEAAAAELRGTLSGEGGEGTPDVVDADEAAAEEVGTSLRAKYAAEPPKRGGKKKEVEVGPSGQSYTPLEKQFMEIKAKNADVLLLMEVGYKYKFHGDDAKTASKELGIVAFPNRNFYTASIPVHRLHIHVKKLISLGYKVGVISQMETAALKKVGDNRNTPFVRELTHLYTAATYVEESSEQSSTLRDEPVRPGGAPPPTNALVAIVEQPLGGIARDDRVRIALVSVVPNTGDVVWDEFDDSEVRSELETRLTHLQPAELLLPASGLSKATEKVLKHAAGSSSSASVIRVERIHDVMEYSAAFDFLTTFYRRGSDVVDLAAEEGVDVDMEEQNGTQSDSITLASGLPAEEAVLALVDFPKQIVVALAVAVRYMKAFGLQSAFRHRSSFTKFINRAHMLLSSNTLVNLEVYRNQTDGGAYGSLVWLLDQTKTRMGRRLMREWIGRPLLDVNALRARLDAVEEMVSCNTYYMEKLRSLLVNMPDLVRGLTRVQYGKATPTELATILVGLVRVASEFKPDDGAGKPFHSEMLNNILTTLPTIAEPARAFLNAIDLKAARANNEADLWTDPDKYPEIQDAKDCISICESELAQHLKEVRKVVKKPALNYVTVSGIEYLVEVPLRDTKLVPPKWVKISSTKAVSRFHTPEILQITKEREQHKETLAASAKRAFQSFQADISECHQLVVVSRLIAVIDCMISLASTASGPGYTKPTFVSEPRLSITQGRHPMVEALRDQAYVPFDIDFSESEGRSKVITGPNMAGKSSCVRAAALIVCLAQIGSFVPADAATLGIHDAVLTRMGASDDIGRGKSTFMVELSETSDILRTITPRTLVILDELGRGTSTFDGVAIAYATLAHLAQAGCNSLFVTHYPLVAEQLAAEFPDQVSNWHMAFDERRAPDGHAEITFLYRLERGLAEASFGVWCARLAGLPASILDRAQSRADDLKRETDNRSAAALSRRAKVLLDDLAAPNPTPASVLRHAEMLATALAIVR